MVVSISTDNEQFVEAAVESGQYPDRSALIDEALRLLKRRDEMLRAVDAGIDQLNRGETVDADTVFDRLSAKYSRNTNCPTD